MDTDSHNEQDVAPVHAGSEEQPEEARNAWAWGIESVERLVQYADTRCEQQRLLCGMMNSSGISKEAALCSVYEGVIYGAFVYAVDSGWTAQQVVETVNVTDACAKRALLAKATLDECYQTFAAQVESLALKDVYSVKQVKKLTSYMCSTFFKFYETYLELASRTLERSTSANIQTDSTSIRKSVQLPLRSEFDLNEAEMEECTAEEKTIIEHGLSGDPVQDIGPLDDRLASALRQALDRSAEEKKQTAVIAEEERVEDEG